MRHDGSLNEISDGGIVLDGREITGAARIAAWCFKRRVCCLGDGSGNNVALGVDVVYAQSSQKSAKTLSTTTDPAVGLAMRLDKQASELSNGMKQRVWVGARLCAHS